MVLKGSAARRVRNDCISRSEQVWEQAIRHYVEMRPSQVELLLPSEPPPCALAPPAAEDLQSLSVGVLVKLREGAPPLALLAAGARAGVQLVRALPPSGSISPPLDYLRRSTRAQEE